MTEYWINRCDGFIVAGVIFAVVGAVGLFFSIVFTTCPEEELRAGARRALKVALPMFLIGMTLALLVPKSAELREQRDRQAEQR